MIRNSSSKVYKRGLDNSTELYHNLQFPLLVSQAVSVQLLFTTSILCTVKSRFPDPGTINKRHPMNYPGVIVS